MRFKYQIGTVDLSAPLPPPLAVACQAVTRTIPVAQRADRKWPGHGVIFGATLVAAAGCASLDSRVSKAWKIEPVFNVSHATQSSPAYYSLGQYYDGSQAWGKAIDAYRKAIAADANNIDAHNALGVALAQSGRYADAETALRHAVALAPARTYVRNNLGYVLLLGGKPGEAVLELKAVVEQDGDSAIAKENLRDAMARSNVAARVAVSAPLTPAAPLVAAGVAGVAEVAAVASATSPLSVPTASHRAAPATPPAMRWGFEPTIASIEQSAASASDANVSASLTMAGPPDGLSVPMPLAAVPTSKVPMSRLEISNGNGVAGMAARVGRWLATQGLQADRLTNQQPFAQQQTVIQYRNGHAEAALRVARSLPANAKAELAPLQGLRSDVRVVIGRDWVQTAACLGNNSCRPALTAVAAATTQ